MLIAAGITDEDERDYDKVLKKFTSFFNPLINIIYERAKFNLRIKRESEAVSDFITDIHHLASTCDLKN